MMLEIKMCLGLVFWIGLIASLCVYAGCLIVERRKAEKKKEEKKKAKAAPAKPHVEGPWHRLAERLIQNPRSGTYSQRNDVRRSDGTTGIDESESPYDTIEFTLDGHDIVLSNCTWNIDVYEGDKCIAMLKSNDELRKTIGKALRREHVAEALLMTVIDLPEVDSHQSDELLKK